MRLRPVVKAPAALAERVQVLGPEGTQNNVVTFQSQHRFDTMEAVSQRLRARSVEALYVPPLPGRLDGSWVVVLADPCRCVVGGDASKLGDAGQGRPCATYAAAAGHFDPDAFNGETMCLLERGPRVVGVERKPEVRPAQPSTGPGSLGGWPSSEIESPVRAWLGLGAQAKAATAKTRAVRQLHNA
jgi:hypothetical protein